MKPDGSFYSDEEMEAGGVFGKDNHEKKNPNLSRPRKASDAGTAQVAPATGGQTSVRQDTAETSTQTNQRTGNTMTTDNTAPTVEDFIGRFSTPAYPFGSSVLMAAEILKLQADNARLREACKENHDAALDVAEKLHDTQAALAAAVRELESAASLLLRCQHQLEHGYSIDSKAHLARDIKDFLANRGQRAAG